MLTNDTLSFAVLNSSSFTFVNNGKSAFPLAVGQQNAHVIRSIGFDLNGLEVCLKANFCKFVLAVY